MKGIFLQCLLEHLQLNNAVVNADFVRELQYFETCNFFSIRLSQFTGYTLFVIPVAQSL
jgi:hypothetical protein